MDNNLFVLKELFQRKTSFTKQKRIFVYNVEEDDVVVCQGLIIYAEQLPEYIQLCFFESEPNQDSAVKLLVEKAIREYYEI